MKIFHIVFPFILCGSLFAETVDKQFIFDSPAEISLINTNGLDPKLKQFLYKYYQKNYSGNEYIKTVESIQFSGTYIINQEKIGTIKIIKKRPNKYKSHIKKNDGSEEVVIYDGKTLQKSETTGSDLPIEWQTLDINAPENLWIHYEQLFDSAILNPKDPNKKISLGDAYMEDGQVIQPITIALNKRIQVTHFITVRDNLTKRTFVESNDPETSAYNSYTIYYENYESVNGILFPKKITTEFSEDTSVSTEFSDIQFNLGISDFFFKAISF